MSDDWDVIEELEFWDDYKELYGEDLLEAKVKKNKKKTKQPVKQSANYSSGGGCLITVLLIIIFVLCIATVAVNAKNLSPKDKGWKLQWSDEFNGKKLNEDVWTYDIGTGMNGWGNGELQSYTDRKKNMDFPIILRAESRLWERRLSSMER